MKGTAAIVVLVVGILLITILMVHSRMSAKPQPKPATEVVAEEEFVRYKGTCATVASTWANQPTVRESPLLRIIRGTPVVTDKYPFVGAIFFKDMFLCSCCLITPTLALGAAHCVAYMQLNIVFGSATIDKLGTRAVTRDVKKTHIHPEFDTSTFDNDLVVFEIDPVDTIYPACLCYTNKELNDVNDFIITGWGTTETWDVSPVLRETTLKRSITCLQFDPKKHICASNQLLESGPCGGDSGSPLFFAGTNDVYIVCGVVSRGSKTCTSRPSIFTKVPYYIKWITSFF